MMVFKLKNYDYRQFFKNFGLVGEVRSVLYVTY